MRRFLPRQDDNTPTNAAQDEDDDDTPVYWAMHAATRSYAETEGMVSFEEIMEHGGTPQEAFDKHLASTRVHRAFAARVTHTQQTGPPSMSKVTASQELRDKWTPPMRKFIDAGLDEGSHFYITAEQVASGEYRVLFHVNVLDEKRLRPGESRPSSSTGWLLTGRRRRRKISFRAASRRPRRGASRCSTSSACLRPWISSCRKRTTRTPSRDTKPSATQ